MFDKGISEIKQSRSRFQMEKFVVGQHDTPEMQYYQICLEADAVLSSVKEAKLRVKKMMAEIEELRETGKKSDEIEAEILELSVERVEATIVGQERELKILKDLYDKYPKYTREEIEQAQPEYWQRRLMRVAQLQMLAGGVGWAHLEAIYQAGYLPDAISESDPMKYLDQAPKILGKEKVEAELFQNGK